MHELPTQALALDDDADQLPTFDLCGPLPAGTTLLEASAGTGKTFTVAGLVTRYVAEGHARLDEMLVITFGRAASQELRERVRDQLVEAQRALSLRLHDTASARHQLSDNELLALLLDAPPAELTLRHQRLIEALASFDAATIATTHQFCQLVLRSLGVAGDTDPGVSLVESLDELVEEVVDDLYLHHFGQRTSRPPFDRAEALALAARAVGDPQARLADTEAAAGTPAAERVDFARAVRVEVERRKRRLGILSYDDLLSRLAAALEDPDAPARARMRERWRIVLVDEFQDTDPVQWQVIDRAFTGHASVVLIGDPKQAIYAFRGGDVVTYLDAARTATTRATLGTNWRSDAALVQSLQLVLAGAALGDDEIVVRPVRAAHPGSRLAGLPHPSPFRLRALARDGLRLTKQGEIPMRTARQRIAQDCAADIAEVLRAEATYADQPVRARDIAVLVSARDHGMLVQRELRALGVPAVLAGGGQVLATTAAEEFLALLEALEQPYRSARVRAAALTSFFGETTDALVAGGDVVTDRVAEVLRGWAVLLRSRGVAALMEAADERGLTARVLSRIDGERLLTDLRHLGQLLHDVAVRERLGLTALLQWLREERTRAIPGADRTRRLDSDAAAVQIVTIHASKGLQYPLVYLPFAFEKFLHTVDTALFHDADGVRTLDVSGAGPQWAGHVERHQAEESGEELRELYVALTRAQAQVVAWWAPTPNTATGGLHRMLFGRRPGTRAVPDRQGVREDDYAEGVLRAIEELGGPAFESAVPAVLPALSPAPAPGPLAARPFARGIDTEWRRTSYSGLIRIEESGPAVGSEPEVPGLDDEPDLVEDEEVVEPAALTPTAGADLASPMGELPAGAAFGSLVHAVLEVADPHAADLHGALTEAVADQQRWWPVAAPASELATALLPLHDTPLGPALPGLTLRDFGRRDRLCELDFEFPLDGGDLRGGASRVLLRDLAGLWRELLPAGDPLAPYAAKLEQPLLGDQQLHGYLSGSIDVVLRTPGEPRFVVVDYKTNLLGEVGRPVTAADYLPDRLTEAMLHSHYPLQATLYSVVLHRYLRWRLPAYDPERHLGGVLYLYLRGMCGPDTPVIDGHPAGVFTWRPPAAFVLAVSELLAGRGGRS